MKYILKKVTIVLGIFLIGVLASVITEHYLFPRVSSTTFFSNVSWLKKAAENVTIINKTEQVTVKDEDSIDQVVSRIVPSVVNIISVPETPKSTSAAIKKIQATSGTGVIVTSDGLIVMHSKSLIMADSKYFILAFDGNKYEAEFVGYDQFTELAYLKINVSNLNPIVFANSSDIKPGKKTIAISNSSVEYENNYASGLISGINRTFNIIGKTVSLSEKIEGIFECDYLSNKSYAGGPVITYNGEMAGLIGSVIIDNKEAFYVIPSNQVRKSIDLAIKGEISKRPTLGLYYLPISKEYAIKNGLDRDRGAIIYSASGNEGLAIISGSPAEKAGFKIGDIIIAVNGKEVNLDNPLSNLVNEQKAGDKIEFLVLRGGKEIKIEAQL